ncbi:hypothetical protein [Lentibacillus sediminis]|uniref:hypothetical protein n=1 Tax=Lentibacillus sediminis TaxID=1940529 RepID=UPI000C1C2F4A|nr:hypothetical protein [Lentibacillus sediminis]
MGRQIQGMLYFCFTDARYSLMIFWTILLAILLVSLPFAYYASTLEEGFFGFTLTAPIYVWCSIMGYLAVKESIPFSIKMGATRKNIFVSLGLFFASLSLGLAIVVNVLHELVLTFMNAIGVDIFFFIHPVYFLEDTWMNRVIMDTAMMFFLFAVMFLIGLVFYKFGLAGGGSLLGMLLLVLLTGVAQGWLVDAATQLFRDFSMVFFYQLLGIGLVLYCISFLFLRRITIVKVK